MVRFDLPILAIGIVALLCAISVIILYAFVGVPDNFPIQKVWFIPISALIGLVAAFMLRGSIINAPIQVSGQPPARPTPGKGASPPLEYITTPTHISPLVSSLKRQVPVSAPEMVSSPSPMGFSVTPSGAPVQPPEELETINELRAAFADAFEETQGIAPTEPEPAPDVERYFEPRRAKTVAQMNEERKRSYYSQTVPEKPAGNSTQAQVLLPSDLQRASPPAGSKGALSTGQPLRSPSHSVVVPPVVLSPAPANGRFGINSLSYVSSSAMQPKDKSEPVSIVGNAYTFENLYEVQYIKSHTMRPQVVDFKANPNDPNNKAQVSLFGMKLKVTGKPKEPPPPVDLPLTFVRTSAGAGITQRAKLEDLRKRFHGK